MRFLNFTKNIFSILMLVSTFLIGGRVVGQSTIALQDFEASPASPVLGFSTTNIGSPSVATYSSGNSGTTAAPASSSLYASGLRGYRVAGPSSGSATTGQIITFNPVNTSNYSSIQLSYRVAAMSIGSTGNGMDNAIDQILVEVSPDGGINWYQQSILNCSGSGSNARWGFNVSGAATRVYAPNNSFTTHSVLNTNSSGQTLSGSNAITTVSVTDLPIVSNLIIRLTLQCNSSNESWLIDDVILTGTACTPGTWIGGTSGNYNNPSNWCGGVPSPGSNLTIPAGTTVTLDGSTEVEVGNLTINTTGALLLPLTAKLTVNGVLTNNGTMTIESGATFKQGQSSSLASNTTGTFNVKQFVTGAGGATPNGRFWYMGVPISNLTRAGAFGAASGANRLWSWTESTGWSAQLTDNTTLNPKTGYVFRTGSDVTLNFSGTSLYADNVGVSGLTNNNGSFAGCNLLSNPYTAYLNWVDVYNASTGISSTYCIPTSNGTSMVYDTYNASGFVSANPSGTAMTNFIAPMQAFWAVVNPGSTGTISMTKAMLSHQPTALGLKDLVSNSAFARLNLVSGSFSDQVVVYTDVNATAELEDYDSKKFFVANAPQVYCKVGEDKLVINALKKGKAHTTAPLTLELPTSQVYQFEMVESFVENGVVLLEDRQEGIFQDMGVNPVYEFYGALGLLSDRFVLHFQHPNIGIDEGQAGLDEVTSSTINVLSNQNGIINVSLSSDLTASGEVQILDASGRLVQTALIKGQETKLQITEGVGVYFVRVLTPIKSEMKKVMVY